ncbi:fibronectin type III domain-containing protein [Tenacibaculum sp.]|uniref:fibronectin type III domain-containing protein n=1 Tax=Tenacibaculum sp. TaxID=1906242 RepID=UPI003D0E13A6
MKKILLSFIILFSISCSNSESDDNLNGDNPDEGADVVIDNGNSDSSCPKPLGLEIISDYTTSTSVICKWADYDNTQLFNIEYGARGFSIGDGTRISTGDKSKEITGLTGNTEYDFYVRSNCGGENYSEWAGPHSFITKSGTVSDSFTGNYLIEEITNIGSNGPVLSNGSIVTLSISGQDNRRKFDTKFFPDNCSPIYTFYFVLQENGTLNVPLLQSACSCNGSYYFGPSNEDSSYNLNNDSVFYLKFSSDVYNDCSSGVKQVTYKFTKQ